MFKGKKNKFSKKMILYYENSLFGKLHYLVSGSCKAYKFRGEREIFLYELSAGSFISDFTLDGVCALSTVEFTSNSEVIEIDFDFAKENHMRELFSAVIERNLLLSKCLDVNLVFDGAARVANLLLADISNFNSLKRKVVAERLNISSETLSRILNRFLISGFILVDAGIVSVVSKDDLADLL